MNINMTSAIVLIGAFIALILNVKIIYSINNISKSRRIAILFTRVLLIILVTLGANGVSLNSNSDIIHTVFLVDRSSSISSEKENIENFINDAIKRKSVDDRVSIISFAADASTDYIAFNQKKEISLNSIINNNATNYEDSLKKAISMILASENGRIVLISDGFENQSDYSSVIESIKAKNIEVKFVKINSKHGTDSQISDIKIPKDITVGENFQIDLELYSTKSSSAILRIYKGSEIFSEKEIKLSSGKNNFIYTDVLSKSGNQIYSAEVDMLGDFYVNNNKFSTMTNGIGSPRLLIVGDGNGSEVYIANLARDNGYKVDSYVSEEVPSELKNLLKYQAIILNNITLENTASKFISSLKTYVEDFGGGLFMTGGANSYALGGYYKTELEEMLPLNMEMKRDGVLPSVSMAIIIDRSGSMQGNKMDMAKEAARKAVAAMKPNDSMAVLAFDDTRAWVSRLNSTENKEEIIDAIGSIKSGGGTAILPALRDAIDELKRSSSKLKHIILLTDGQAENAGYDKLIDDAIENKITISSIAVGQGSDVRLLSYIAENANGRFYNVVNPSNIPSIFTKETFLASKSYINEDVFTPILTSDSSLVKSLYSENYDIMGYVSTSLKANSELILKTNKDEPLLASWNYGLGKVSAWTSDGGNDWSNTLLTASSGKSMLLSIIDDVLIDNSSEDINISSAQNGSSVNIILGKEELSTAQLSEEIILIDKNGEEAFYKGEIYNNQFVKTDIKNIEEGLYIIKSSAILDGEKIYNTSPLLVNYSSEYSITRSDDVSKDLVDRLKGEFVENSSEIFTDIKSKVYDKKDFSDIILIASIFVLMLDVYIRRFRNDKFTTLITILNRKVESKIDKSRNEKNQKNKNIRIKVANKGDLSTEKNSSKKDKLIKADKKSRVNEELKKDDYSHLNRLLKAKEKRK